MEVKAVYKVETCHHKLRQGVKSADDGLCDICKVKLIRLVAGQEGATSVALDSEGDTRTLTVWGNIDPASILRLIRKKFGTVCLISIVSVVSEKKKHAAEQPNNAAKYHPQPSLGKLVLKPVLDSQESSVGKFDKGKGWKNIVNAISNLFLSNSEHEKQDCPSSDIERGCPSSDIESFIEDEKQNCPSSDIESFIKGILYILGKSNDFEKDKLIQLWMAGGFIVDEPMEVNGFEYFEKLVSAGYILYSKSNSLYKVNLTKLEIELDIILEKSSCLRLESTSHNDAGSAEILHVSVIGNKIDEKVFKTLQRFKKLRTLLFLGNYRSRLQQVPRDLFLCHEALRALDLSGTHIKELPSSVEKMIHLRYLDLSWTFIELLPERIYLFEKLQTLKLKGCSRLQRLPNEMKKLTELRHLDLDVLGQLVSFPEGIGALEKLRTLSAFPVGVEKGFKISELKYLNNLTGEFCIANLENVRRADEAKQASLTLKRSIKKLELRWSDYECEEAKIEDEYLLTNLCPCLDLEELQIVHYHGTKFPTWVAAVPFHRLFSITLFKCEHISELPPLEKLPSLRTLELIGLNNVSKIEFVGNTFQEAFVELKKLSIDEMLSLEIWTEPLEGDFPCLEELSIKDCPKLPELPSLVYFPSIQYLEVSGCAMLAFWSEKKLSSSLRTLIVEDCPLIEERCSEQEGLDWHKIQHVPTVWINQVAILPCREENEKSDDESHWENDAFQ